MADYNHSDIEKKWQDQWEKDGLYTVENAVADKENEYVLVEFPYPSGNLHVGHWYAFTVPDMYARFWRMQGKQVLFPFGFDAFGLPAENAAIKRGLNPRDWTYENIEAMRTQLRSMGGMFDWSREVVTCDPAYYKWTQWQFIQFFNANLVSQKETQVNWCPSCKTVLANEQVVNNACERCDSEVEHKSMLQWNIAITQYADRLLKDLNELDWPEPIKESQRNWIGKSEGAEIDFPLTFTLYPEHNTWRNPDGTAAHVRIFTTRPDTLYGTTYIVLAPEHHWVRALWDTEHDNAIANKQEVTDYVKAAQKKSDIERTAEGREKTGVELKGIKAINPATKEEIPVYVSDYVLAHYGTGAIMAVPAHDERDFAFATQFELPIVPVIEAEDTALPYTGTGTLINSGDFDGRDSDEAKAAITEHVGGALSANYKLRDWTVSRQRYWGVPIPIIHCANCGAVPVPDEQLPVELPAIDDYLPRDDGKSPLAKATDWLHTTCPSCGGDAERETDTLDTFVDSSWYYIRYTDPNNAEQFASSDAQAAWLPVDFYSGGAEHTTMHLLYSRFWHKALFDLGLVNEKEPYTRRMNRGLIMGPDGNKMSKSKGNVIDPDDVVARLGADTVRTYLAFIGPFNEVGHYPWSPDGIVGVRRFLERVWRLGQRPFADTADEDVDRALHKTIQKVRDDMRALKFNTAIAALMTLVNTCEKTAPTRDQYATLLQLLSPCAPHITEELWREQLGNTESIHLSAWPEYDSDKLTTDTVNIAVQVNGKLRATLTLPTDTDEEAAIAAARADANVAKWLDGATIARTIFVPQRLINFVTT